MPRTRTAAVLLALAVLAGCAGVGDVPPEERMNAETELRSRASLEDTLARYERMQQDVRDRLDAAIGPFAWEQQREGAESTCGFDFPQELGGRNVFMAPWGFDGAIPDDEWPRAAQIITDTTAEYGFTAADLQLDQPGYHILSGIDTTLGASYDFGTEVNTTMQVTTGCHLPADAA